MSKEMKVVLKASYQTDKGTTPAGKVIALPDKEAKRLLDADLAVLPESLELVSSPADSVQLQARVEELEAELDTVKADRDAKLAESQKYAEGLEAKLKKLEEQSAPKASKK